MEHKITIMKYQTMVPGMTKSCSMRKRDSIRLQSSASDWMNSRQKARYYRKWENQQRAALE